MREDVYGQAILGTKDFVKKIYQEYLSKRKQDKKEQSGLQDMQRMPSKNESFGNRKSIRRDNSLSNKPK